MRTYVYSNYVATTTTTIYIQQYIITYTCSVHYNNYQRSIVTLKSHNFYNDLWYVVCDHIVFAILFTVMMK